MSKTYYAIADCKHGIKPQFCFPCAKERIGALQDLLKDMIDIYKYDCDCQVCTFLRKRILEALK